LNPPTSHSPKPDPPQLVPPGFDAWFARAVSREPGRRFANAAEALASLVPVLEPAVVWQPPALASSQTGGSALSVASSVSAASPRSQRLGLAIGAAVAVGALGLVAASGVGLGLWYWYGLPAEPSPGASVAPPPLASAPPSLDPDPSPDGSASSGAARPVPVVAAPRKAPTAREPASTATPKPAGVPAGYRSRGVVCGKGADACHLVSCCKPGELLSPFPECACYFKLPTTGVPAGAQPRNVSCTKGSDACTVNCCKAGEFLSPFPECSCYFVPPAPAP
jgi:hypothetical protein